jgi:hypothetical protein
MIAVVAGCFVAASLKAQNTAPAEKITPKSLASQATGWMARYIHVEDPNLRGSVVKSFTLAVDPVRQQEAGEGQWIRLDATKVNGDRYRIWLLSQGYPPLTLRAAQDTAKRYIVQEGDEPPTEFRGRFSGQAVLPRLGGWKYLWPRVSGQSTSPLQAEPDASEVDYLGHHYRRAALTESTSVEAPSNLRSIELISDVLVGLPHNTRQKEETRRYDDSDYELVRLTREDYREMIQAGMNCVRVDAEQLRWIADLNVYYWGVGGSEVPYPECLYRSSYLGPELFLDEPAVCTRDYVIRPRLAKEAAYRKNLTPQTVMAAFAEYFRRAIHEGAATSLLRGLKARPDVDLGTMIFRQENLFSWETMVCSAAYQLSQDTEVPAAMVFEPPGRVGTWRTLPELNMTYGCQLPVDDPKCLADIIYGFLRGAAKMTDKTWGMSIYGAVDRADAFWFMTHAYDLGATHFFFWDTARAACVPYQECLALARNLRAHVENYPDRDLEMLKGAAETAILLPPGYNLGHVHLGKGSLWGLGELNLERTNQFGIQYRVVMSNFFIEIENCFRWGVAFDLLWDLPGIIPTGYQEVIRIREDGKVEVRRDGQLTLLDHARTPTRPHGDSPELAVQLSATQGKAPLAITAQANVLQKSAPLFYTFGTDTEGIYRNAVVAWELYGPGEEDYRFLTPPGLKPNVHQVNRRYKVKTEFRLSRPGNYRLRAATVDRAGRTRVTWTPITVTD